MKDFSKAPQRYHICNEFNGIHGSYNSLYVEFRWKHGDIIHYLCDFHKEHLSSVLNYFRTGSKSFLKDLLIFGEDVDRNLAKCLISGRFECASFKLNNDMRYRFTYRDRVGRLDKVMYFSDYYFDGYNFKIDFVVKDQIKSFIVNNG